MKSKIQCIKRQALYSAITRIKTIDEASMLFEDLCTPSEIEAMADRWCVLEAIKSGQTHRQVHKSTGVSMTTIGRVARCVVYGAGGYNLIFNRKKYAKHKKN